MDGDFISFHDLYERYARDVHRFAYYLTGNAADAEDITAETFSRVWTVGGAVRVATVKSYLIKIARNYFLETRRKRRRETALDPSFDLAVSPSEQLFETRDAIDRLPEADRELILLRAGAGLSYEEIAASMNLTVTAVRVRIHRARTRLADILKGEIV